MACVATPLRWIAVWTVVFLTGGGSDPRRFSDIFSLKNLPASRCLPQKTRSRCAGGQTSSAMPQGLSENQIWSREPSKTPRHEAVSPLSLPFGRPRNMHGSGPFPQSECKVRKNLRNNNDIHVLFFKKVLWFSRSASPGAADRQVNHPQRCGVYNAENLPDITPFRNPPLS